MCVCVCVRVCGCVCATEGNKGFRVVDWMADCLAKWVSIKLGGLLAGPLPGWLPVWLAGRQTCSLVWAAPLLLCNNLFLLCLLSGCLSAATPWFRC